MKRELDIHNYAAKLAMAVRRVEQAGICERNRELILCFGDACSLDGLGEQNAQQNTAPASRSCPRCETINTPDAKYCLKCGGVLNVRTAMQIVASDSGYPARPESQALAEERVVRAVLERLREGKTLNGSDGAGDTA